MPTGRSVRLFLAEGTPTGILTAEIVNWTGHVLSAPRIRLETALKRSELKKTGIYILYGSPFDADLPLVYIGEGDDISTRLSSHSRDDDKDFWERFIAVTNKDMNLTKAHVKYLEGRLITLLKEAKKSQVTNRTDPSFDKLPEADISDMESFLEQLQLVLPVVGVDFFRKVVSSSTIGLAADSVETPTFAIENKRKGISATAREVDGEFVVLAGSTGDLKEAASFSERLKNLRNQNLAVGKISKVGENTFRLIEDIAFSSPSAAAVFLFGSSRNGRTTWYVQGNTMNYGEWKEALLQD
ncbi:GIY-YIG nuclease family protein [Falsiruegeria mediterranea]